MWKTFYSPAELLKKPHVVPSLIASICIVFVLVIVVGLWLNGNMIHVSPIAEATFVPPPRSGSNAITVVNRDTVSDEIGKESVLYGYLANILDVCKVYESIDDRYEYSTHAVKPIVVVVRTNIESQTGTIGTMTIGKDICGEIKKLNEVHIYVVSDVPFRGIYSTQKPQYFTVAPLKK
jgi:hypothetical protein